MGVRLLAITVVVCLNVGWAYAQTPWEVAVVFLGAKIDDPEHQKDIDRNIVELADSRPNEWYRLSIAREFENRFVQYFVDAKSNQGTLWDPLLFDPPKQKVNVYGELKVQPADKDTFLLDDAKAKSFFAKAYQNPNSRRLLVVYAHGFAFRGLLDIKLKDLRTQLVNSIAKREGRAPLDILWIDACFMGNLESAYELREVAPYYVSTEEAEFSAGSPFQSFRILGEGPDDSSTVARSLAQDFLDSYSYLEKGVQRRAVHSSSATISVVETRRLATLVKGLSGIAYSLRPLSTDQKKVIRRSQKRIEIQMEGKTSLVDLGNLLRYLKSRKDVFSVQEAQDRIDSLLQLLELKREEKVKRTPRVWMIPPREDYWAVYGYNFWSAGYKGDDENLDRLPKNLKPRQFVPGPNKKEWPSRPVHIQLNVSPFAPTLDVFHFFFVSPKNPSTPVTPVKTLERVEDIVLFEASHGGNPVIFSGYTQGIGKMGEKYAGLSILDPTEERLPADYSYLDFSELTHWEELLAASSEK